ncbi:MAG: hypothetical protein IJC26_07875 [Clostridia bacterium]|nr:hypothetical protein [Clostridia bacterium]
MLIRLLKYDVKKIIKFLTVFFVLALFFGVLTRIFGAIDDSLAVTIIKGICNGTTISMMFSLLINCFMRSWVLFRASLFGDESYLTHTLPIDRKTHYTAKACTAAISILFCMVSILIVFFTTYWTKAFRDLVMIPLEPLAEYLGVSVWGILVVMLLVLFLEFFYAVQIGFTGILIGHRFLQKKIVFSVIFGFAGYMACQILTLLGMLAIGMFDAEFFKLFKTNDLLAFKPETIFSIVAIGIAFYAFFCIAAFFVNVKLLKKGVNVE